MPKRLYINVTVDNYAVYNGIAEQKHLDAALHNALFETASLLAEVYAEAPNEATHTKHIEVTVRPFHR